MVFKKGSKLPIDLEQISIGAEARAATHLSLPHERDSNVGQGDAGVRRPRQRLLARLRVEHQLTLGTSAASLESVELELEHLEPESTELKPLGCFEPLQREQAGESFPTDA